MFKTLMLKPKIVTQLQNEINIRWFCRNCNSMKMLFIFISLAKRDPWLFLIKLSQRKVDSQEPPVLLHLLCSKSTMGF